MEYNQPFTRSTHHRQSLEDSHTVMHADS